MNNVLSRHAKQRMQQRGLKVNDIELILVYGTPVKRQGILLRDKDIARAIARRKAEIQSLERLRGMKVVVSDDGEIITMYHATIKHQKNMTKKH